VVPIFDVNQINKEWTHPNNVDVNAN